MLQTQKQQPSWLGGTGNRDSVSAMLAEGGTKRVEANRARVPFLQVRRRYLPVSRKPLNK